MEEWKEVPSNSELMASSLGRIKRKSFYKSLPNGGFREYKSKPTFGVKRTSSKNAKHTYFGYLYRGIGNVKVHRLVCEAFHGPPELDKNVVIHLDENALNNVPSNLKWGTQKENLNMEKIKEYHKKSVYSKFKYKKEIF
jgi:hypothetical protein